MKRIALSILCLLLTAVVTNAAAWPVAEQPDLFDRLAKAPTLTPEDLDKPARGVTSWTFMMAPNPDGKTWDALQWYFATYGGPTWLYAVDLGTGEVKKQRFPDRRQIHMCGQELAPNGKYFIVTPDWKTGMELYVYDPATNTLEEHGVIVPKLAGETRRTALGPDGMIYGTGSYQDSKKAGAYQLDPNTLKVRDYGPIGPSHAPNGAWGYWIGVCDTHIYVASGKMPWYLVAVNIQTGAEEVLLKTPLGNNDMRIRGYAGGATCIVSGQDVAKQEYWLYHGKATPKKADDKPPWTAFAMPSSKAPPRPKVYRGQVDPDADGNAYLWFRTPEAAAKAPKTPTPEATAEDLGWQRIALGQVETYPRPIHRLAALPDGRLFGTAQAYIGRFLFDPKTGKGTPLGNGGPSIYAMAPFGDKLYMSGYASAPVCEYDPARPWTLLRGGPPGQDPPPINSKESNLRQITALFKQTRIKKVMSAAVSADGRVYFGGVGSRDYAGGGLGWYAPETGKPGGMWEPFRAYRIYWLAPALDGKQLVCSTKVSRDEKTNEAPASAKLFVYDTETDAVLCEIVPVENAPKSGPCLEVSPGRVIGITDDPEVKNGGILYGVDINTGEVLFRRKLPRTLRFDWSHGVSQSWDFIKDAHGNIWTYLDYNVLVRIRPADAHIEPIGRVKRTGKLLFVGDDLYMAGAEAVRRLPGIAKRAE